MIHKNQRLALFTVFLLVVFLAGCLPTAGVPSNKALLKGKVVVPTTTRQEVTGQALAGATVKIVDPSTGEVVATTTTDANGNYSVQVPPGGPYIIQAEKDSLKVLDVSPRVEGGQTQDLGTADAYSTAVALVFQAKVEAGEDPAEINLDEIAEDPKIGNLIQAVEEALTAGEDPTTTPEVEEIVEVIVTPPAPTPSPSPTATPKPTPKPDTTPPTMVSLTAYLADGTSREATDGTLNWTVGEKVTSIVAVVSEPVRLAVDPAQAVVTMSGGSIPADTIYGTIAVDPNDAKKLIITPKPGNETAGLEGTFTFTVAAGVVKDDAGNPNAEITITLEVAPDTTSPTLESVSPQPGEVILSSGETFKFTVDAYDAGGLYELEIDHSMEGPLPEFSVYADGDNPYGTTEDKTEFESHGVTVTYDATEQKWTIDFGKNVTNTIISDHQGKITFYIVIKDLAGNEFGTMYGTTLENTFAYTVKRKAEFTFTAADIKNVIENLHDGTYQWGLWAVRIRPVIEGGSYEIIDASTTQEGWEVEAPSSYPWNTYETNCAWFSDKSGAEVAGNPANPLYMIMDVEANTFWSGGFNGSGTHVAGWAPGLDGLLGGGDDLGTFYSPGYDDGAGGTNVITAVDDLATFTFSFTYTGTWNGQCEFFVDGSKYERGAANDPGAWVANFFGGYDGGGGLVYNTGTGYTIGGAEA